MNSRCRQAICRGRAYWSVKVGPNGNVLWQRGFNSRDGSGMPNAAAHALSLINTSDGGYLVGGNWDDTTSPGTCCRRALLLKVDGNGTAQWQKVYSGGVYWFFNGYSETCSALGGVVIRCIRPPRAGTCWQETAT